MIPKKNLNQVSTYEGGAAPGQTKETPVAVPETPVAETPAAVPETPAPVEPLVGATTPAVQTPVVQATMPSVDPNAMVNLQKQSIPDVSQANANQQARLNQWQISALQQSNKQVDYAVDQGVTELERALEDAQPQFKEQQESITKEEMQARDNSALYAEARGDKGGIGQEQYNSIMNTAAQNRLAVQQAQTKLATDTQRQIADLRAQGEFDKADAALEISQQYLSQLMSLEQWAFNAGMDAAQFRASLDQWLADYQMAIAKYQTDVKMWNAEFGYNQQETLASQGLAMAQAGLPVSNLQYEAIKAIYGQDRTQVDSIIEAAKLAAQSGTGVQDYDSLFADAMASGNPKSYISNNYKRYGFTSSTGLYDDYQNWAEESEEPEETGGVDGVMTENTVAWANSVLAARDGDVDYLAWALEQRGFSEEEIIKVLTAMGLMK